MNTFWKVTAFYQVSIGLVLLFIILEFRKIPLSQRVSGTLLIVISLFFALITDQWATIIVDGIGRTGVFLVLFYAVSWLRFPVNDSPSLAAIRDHIITQPPGKRFLYLAFGVHALGSILNIAGLSFLTSVVEKEKQSDLKRRLSVTLMLGFAAVSCWSPFFIGMIVVLVALPTLDWIDVAPFGMAIAFLMIVTGWIFDKIWFSKDKLESRNQEPVAINFSDVLRSTSILIALIGCTILVVDTLGTNIPIALALIGPPFCLIWYITQKKQDEHLVGRSTKLIKEVIANLPSFRNESLVFCAANVFGLGISAVMPKNEFSLLLNTFIPMVDFKLILLVFVLLGCSGLGLHPVITVISVSAIFPPDVIGVDPMLMALTFLGCWGLSTAISPFSGTTLFMSRVTGEAAHVVGWFWMFPMAVIGTLVVTLAVISLRHLMF